MRFVARCARVFCLPSDKFLANQATVMAWGTWHNWLAHKDPVSERAKLWKLLLRFNLLEHY